MNATSPLHAVIACVLLTGPTVLAQPRILTHPADQYPSQGATVQFRGVAQSSGGLLTMQWWYRDAAIDPKRNPSATKSSLLVSNVTPSLNGLYWMVATDDNGSATSRVAALEVDPTFVKITQGDVLKGDNDLYAPYWVDLDGDGHLDLVVAGGWWTDGGKPVLVFDNQRDGTFKRNLTNALARFSMRAGALAWGDYDQDGDLDAFAGQWEGQIARYFRNDGGRRFTSTLADRYWTVDGENLRTCGGSCADLDGDGWLDLVVGYWGNRATGVWGTNLVLHAVGYGRFEVDRSSTLAISHTWPENFGWADYDGDGDLDLFIATSGDTSQVDLLFENQGGGRFVRITKGPLVETPDVAIAPAWGDYDNDGDFDLLVTRWNQKDLLYRNQGGGVFEIDPAGPQRIGNHQCEVAAWADYDNDGHLDLFIAQFNATSRLFRNGGDGTFEEILTGSPVRESRGYGCGWADYDNDGFMDLVVVDGENAVNFLYQNNLRSAGNRNHWLKVKLQGSASNRDGIGAKVRVKATIAGKPVWQTRQVVCQSHCVDLIAHFGLGDAARVDLLRVEWPSGNVQEIRDFAPDRLLKVTESVGIVPPRPCASLGGSATLRANRAGTYQWRFNGIDLPGQTNAALVLSHVQPDQRGSYSVQVIGTDGLATTHHVYFSVDTQFTKITEGPMVTDRTDVPMGAAWGDINRDGLLDLAVGVGDDTVPYTAARPGLFYLNTGQDTFKRATTEDIGPLAAEAVNGGVAVWTDYDNDGYLDFYQPNSKSGTSPCQLWRGGPGGKFTLVTQNVGINQPFKGWGPWGYCWGDYDRDGHLDVFLTTAWRETRTVDQLFRNQGDGTFERVMTNVFREAIDSQWATFVDYDNDGDPDLHLGATDSTTSPWTPLSRLYRNDGAAGFVDVTDAQMRTSGFYSVWGDYDNDGDLDAFTGFLYRNDGGGKLVRLAHSTSLPSPGETLGFWADYDNDAYLDLCLPWKRQIHRNNRDGTFISVALGNLASDRPEGDCAAWGDYDNDGDLDLFITSRDARSPNYLYRNNGSGNHGLQIELVGRQSNRLGIGARVRAEAVIWGKVVRQLREVMGVSAFSQPRVHFGLGNATAAKLTIEWPSGAVQTFFGVPADRILTVCEPTRLDVVGGRVCAIRCWTGQSFDVEASENLRDWRPLVTVTNETGSLQIHDPDIGQHPYRFYRAKER